MGRDIDDTNLSNAAVISIHAPRMGRDLRLEHYALFAELFQSTRPVWGATSRSSSYSMYAAEFQSTRPVWGATMPSSSIAHTY